MKKVLFVSAADPLAEIETRYKPLWPAYLAAYAEKVLGPSELEFRLASRPLDEELDSFRPDVVGIGSVSQNFNRAIEYASIAKAGGAAVLVGGMHISMLPRCLTADMDAGCLGEGEETFAELMRLFLDRGAFEPDGLAAVKGIAFRKDGSLVVTEPRPVIENLDDIPHPKRSLIGYPSHSYMFTSRGCPYKCVFCASTRFWAKARFASADYVVGEIEELARHGVKTVSFYDDLFVADRRRLAAIADMIVAKGLDKTLRFTCSSRANVVNEAMVHDLARMNVVSVGMGLESGNDRVLAYLKGGVSVADNKRAIDLLKAAGIQANASFVIGSPDETEEEIMDTYAFIRDSRLDFVDTYVLTPLPGTPVWEYALARGLVSDDMDWSRLNVNFETTADKAVVLSERITRDRLIALYRKFRRQRLVRILKSLPFSPWLADVPKVAWGKVVEGASRLWRSRRAGGSRK